MRYYLILLFSAISNYSFGQTLQSISYHSDFEKEVFYSIDSNSVNSVQLFSIVSPTATRESCANIDKVLNDFVISLDRQKINTLDERKKVQLIFNSVHERFLKKYELNTTFGEIFQNGNYNCVSGSALYTIFFDHYNIPYQIKETPDHIYLIAYPETLKILVESTIPEISKVFSSEAYQKESVLNLIKLKFITQEHVDSIGFNNAYMEYFYEEEKVIKKENLAGVQYYNLALIAKDLKDYDKFLQLNEKATFLDPCNRNTYVRTLVLAHLIDQSSFRNLKEVERLAEFSNSVDANNFERAIVGRFEYIIQKSLVENQDTLFLQQSYQLLINKVKSDTIKTELGQRYHTVFAKYFYSLGENRKAYEMAFLGYKINNRNVEIQLILTELVLKKIGTSNSSKKALEEINKYVKELPFLNSNKNILLFKVYSYADLSSQCFHKDQESAGLKYMNMAEQIILNNKDLEFKEVYIEEMYLSAIHYYHQYANAKYRQMATRGLKIFPGNKKFQEWRNTK